MKPLYDPAAPKKPTNLTLNSDLLKKSRALNINLSAALEKVLSQQLEAHARKLLQDPIGSLEHFRADIIGSLDFAVSGV